jgi:hypothetical protein
MSPKTSTQSLAGLLLACALALCGAAQAAIDAYNVQDAQGRQFKAEVDGNRLYLFDKGRKNLAPDGMYRMDGSVRQVSNGMLVPAVRPIGNSASQRPDPAGKQSDEAPKEMPTPKGKQ